jgi:putative transposase
MKLNAKRVKWLVNRKRQGKSSKEIAMDMKISKRRVDQVWRKYLIKGDYPVIGDNLGRPKNPPLTKEKTDMIRSAKKKYKLGARRLEPIIERDYGVHIPHNQIHQFLLKSKLASEEPNKKKRRRWTRYERAHTLSAAHMDWHDSKNGKKVCVIEDDASRDLLVGREFDAENEENSILVFEQLVSNYWVIRPMRELIIDHGASYGAHLTDEQGNWDSPFKRVVESYGTTIIRGKVKHPQTNGKVEKWFDLYEKQRYEYDTIDEFIIWYNMVRPHESLGENSPFGLETPEEAFWRKLPIDAMIGVASRLFGW